MSVVMRALYEGPQVTMTLKYTNNGSPDIADYINLCDIELENEWTYYSVEILPVPAWTDLMDADNFRIAVIIKQNSGFSGK